MRNKIQVVFFALPTLAFLGLFAFGNISSIHKTSSFIFYLSLILTIATIASVSYIGVYLVYVVVPILFVSGFVMFISK